jgi:acyl-CoA synthetase (AMP-forming)/AMP-acid ligase II
VVLASVPWVRGVWVTGEPDAEWGARVVALVEPDAAGAVPADWQRELAGAVGAALARHCVPKRWVLVPRLPFNERGKLDHALLVDCLRR